MRLPEWTKTKHPPSLHAIKKILRGYGLSTVCEEARCPNIGNCFSRPSAAFMILGSVCTRRCRFCAVASGIPGAVDKNEPQQVACAVKDMRLQYVVITSVTRDDLHDGGASHFARTIETIRSTSPPALIEVLTPDFKGNTASLATVLDARPDVFNHNIETVPRLYSHIRPHAHFRRSLDVLEFARNNAGGILIKSGFMLGFGEQLEEVVALMRDLKKAGCDILTIGQYLRPSKQNVPVAEYVKPEKFRTIRNLGIGMGFRHVVAGPMVRSSMNADEMFHDTASLGYQ